MIPEVEGTRPWGALEVKGTECLKGPKTTYTIIAIAEKQSKRCKKGPFSLYIGSPRSHPGNEINGARRGRSLPVPPPGFSSHELGGGTLAVYVETRETIKIRKGEIPKINYTYIIGVPTKYINATIFFRCFASPASRKIRYELVRASDSVA